MDNSPLFACIYCSYLSENPDHLEYHTRLKHPDSIPESTYKMISKSAFQRREDDSFYVSVSSGNSVKCNISERGLDSSHSLSEVTSDTVADEKDVKFCGLQPQNESVPHKIKDNITSVESCVTSMSSCLGEKYLDTHGPNLHASVSQNLEGKSSENDISCNNQVSLSEKESKNDEAVNMSGPHLTFNFNAAKVKESIIVNSISENPDSDNVDTDQLSLNINSDFFSREAVNDVMKLEEINHSEMEITVQSTPHLLPWGLTNKLNESTSNPKDRPEQKKDPSMRKLVSSNTGAKKSEPSITESTEPVRHHGDSSMDSACWECFRKSVFCLDAESNTICSKSVKLKTRTSNETITDNVLDDNDIKEMFEKQSRGKIHKVGCKDSDGLTKSQEYDNNHLPNMLDFNLQDVRKNTGRKLFICAECDRPFTNRGSFNVHMRRHTGEKPFKCEECGRCFIHKGHLNTHMAVHTDKRPFKCEECGKAFRFKPAVTRHMKSHFDERPFMCKECGKTFREKKSLVVHMRKHTGEKPYMCKECGQAFIDSDTLNRHIMRIHTGVKPFECEECGQGFSRRSYLNAHMSTHNGGNPFKCTECDQLFMRKSDLSRHITRTHMVEKPFKCGECGQSFKSKQDVVVHMRIHTGEKPFKCKECSQTFRHRPSLASHMRTHTGEEPFKCKECGQTFRERVTLKIHMRIHTGEKPFKCKLCGHAFRQKSPLNKHMNIHAGESSFKCKECGQTFCEKGALKGHMRIHTGEKLFKCEHCGKIFNDQSHLNEHMRTHTGERLFKCEECGQTFNHTGNLNLHMRSHSIEKPLKCTECNHTFSRKSDLSRHMRLHIVEKPTECHLNIDTF